MTGNHDAPGEAVVRISGVSKHFRGHLGIGKTPAVRGLDLTVARGEIFGLLGPNGAGKTTTIKMLLGLLRPDAGVIRLFGRRPDDVTVKAQLGFLPENPYFYDYLTGREFLDFYARLHRIPASERRDVVDGALARVGLAGRSERPLRKYSKGMLQRLGVAQAIQHRPQLVILDEPMSGLDPRGRRDVRDIILQLRDEGCTVLFSSHILQDAEAICDRVAILKEGGLRWLGGLQRLDGSSVRWFEVGVEGEAGDALPGRVISARPGSALLRVEDIEQLTALLAAARDRGVAVVSVWPRRETLEDLFLREAGDPDDPGREQGAA